MYFTQELWIFKASLAADFIFRTEHRDGCGSSHLNLYFLIYNIHHILSFVYHSFVLHRFTQFTYTPPCATFVTSCVNSYSTDLTMTENSSYFVPPAQLNGIIKGARYEVTIRFIVFSAKEKNYAIFSQQLYSFPTFRSITLETFSIFQRSFSWNWKWISDRSITGMDIFWWIFFVLFYFLPKP